MKRRINHGQAMRSVFGRARVTHFIGRHPARSPRQPLAAVLVQAVEDDGAELEDPRVVAHQRQAATDRVEAGGVWFVVALVVQIGLVHDSGQVPQHGVVDGVATKDRLEAAVAAAVRQLDPAHVERRRIIRHVGRVVHEHELGGRVDEAAQEPRARRPVDVTPGPRRPPHRRAASAAAGSNAAASPSIARRAVSCSLGAK